MSLPYDLIVDIVARLPICFYPTISLVSKSFQSLVASPELYTRRSLLGCTEHCLYAVLYNTLTKEWRLCILRRKVNSSRLVIIRSLPLMDPYGLYVAVGSKIYVVGGEFYDGTERTWKASSIDCRSHTVQHIGIHKRRKFPTVGDIIDGKIYVIHSEGVMVLDTETQKWDPSMKKPDVELGKTYIDGSVVMGDKIYMRNYDNSFVYESKENKWESDQMLNSEEWRGACVVDDVIYYYNSYMKGLRAYDPKQRCWREVKGLEEFSNKMAGSWRSKAGSYGGKLALFFHKDPNGPTKTMELWCAEIALERRDGGEIWGKVQWCDVVFNDGDGRLCIVDKCLAVTV